MKTSNLSALAIGAALLMAAPAFAQTSTPPQKTEGAGNTTVTGPGSAASKQKTEGAGNTTVTGPGSLATKQKTEGAGNTTVTGPGSMASKQKTEGANVTNLGPGSGAYKQ